MDEFTLFCHSHPKLNFAPLFLMIYLFWNLCRLSGYSTSVTVAHLGRKRQRGNLLLLLAFQVPLPICWRDAGSRFLWLKALSCHIPKWNLEVKYVCLCFFLLCYCYNVWSCDLINLSKIVQVHSSFLSLFPQFFTFFTFFFVLGHKNCIFPSPK